LLRMRLTRTGAKKRPSYRVVVADSRAPRDGRHVEILGYYDPMTSPATIKIDTDRAVQWLRNGAEPSERVRILLRHAGVLKAHEEARIADKRKHKEEAEAAGTPAPVRAARKVAATKTAETPVVAAVAKRASKSAPASAAAEEASDTVEAVTDAVSSGGDRKGAAKSAHAKS